MNLLPCPFCGGTATTNAINDNVTSAWTVAIACANPACSAQGPCVAEAVDDPWGKAVELWNWRALHFITAPSGEVTVRWDEQTQEWTMELELLAPKSTPLT